VTFHPDPDHGAGDEAVAAALVELPARREPVGGERLAVLVGEGQPGVARVGPFQPAEVVVEGAVLHHQHDDGVDRHLARAGQAHAGLALGRLGEERVGREGPGEAG